MKLLLRLLLLAMMGSAYAQSNLPQCQTTNRNNCVDQIITDGGTKYIGEFKDNVPNGRGKYFFPSGLRYEGEILNDYRHGRGTIYRANGEVFQSGIYEKGVLVRPNQTPIYVDNYEKLFEDQPYKTTVTSSSVPAFHELT